MENIPNLTGDLDLALIIGAVNLGHQGLEDRGTRRHFGDFYARLVRGGDPVNQGAHPLGDVVALRLSLALGHQVDLDVGLVRSLAARK